MSHLFLFPAILLLLSIKSSAQKRWDGGGGDGQWNNALNWTTNTLPLSLDDVILDNSIVSGKYVVKLPAGNISVTVKTIVISPGATDSIELILPATNTAVPALTVTGPGYGLILNNRGIFRNASGAASGTPVNVADSIRIKTGGRWIHNTARAHASNVQVLSAVIGTDKGIFEFDAPNASTTISLSGQIFGTLVLKAVAAGGALNYTGAGTSKVKIRGDLEINPGVTLGLNFSDSIVVDGNYVQNGGTLNLGNTNRSVVLVINKNIMQAASGIITESGTGTQEILLRGNIAHTIDMKGTILNQVAFTLDANAPSDLLNSLTLPYKFNLRNGILNTTAVNILRLQSGCSIFADTLSTGSFINGPMKKEGLSNANFLFPVGGSGYLRWLRLKNATGDFTVEYKREDPRILSSSRGIGINHISSLEYWSIAGSVISNNAAVILSFIDPQSGGVTNLSELRVARLLNAVWEDAGNTAFSGSAGSNGWVNSNAASGFSAGDKYFALASTTGQENPLPLSSIMLRAAWTNNTVQFDWELQTEENLSGFELQESTDNIHFRTIAQLQHTVGRKKYQYAISKTMSYKLYYRIKAIDANGARFYSRVVRLKDPELKPFEISGNSIVKNNLHLSVSSPENQVVKIMLFDLQGIIRKKIMLSAKEGLTVFDIDLTSISKGIYLVYGISSGTGFTPNAKTPPFRFLKP